MFQFGDACFAPCFCSRYRKVAVLSEYIELSSYAGKSRFSHVLQLPTKQHQTDTLICRSLWL